MTKIDTFIHKDKRTGWRAETKIKLGEGWQLDITTRKGNDGQLISHATVGRVERGFVTHRLYTDYSRYAIKREKKCTEKNVGDQHAETLSMIDAILDDVRAHYARMNEPITIAVAA
jgi:hypothetical protein